MPAFLVPLYEFNPCHNPAGSPAGGEFCSTTGALKGEWEHYRSENYQSDTFHVSIAENRNYRMHFRQEYSGSKYQQTVEDATVKPDEVDLVVEHRAVRTTMAASEDFWRGNDSDAAFIKRGDGDYPVPLDDRKLSAMLVMTLKIEDYGAGSGGPGSAKVFWGPYSAPNRRDRLKTDNDKKSQWDQSYADSLGVDPVYVLAHELHHSWGQNSEFDSGSEVVALDAHLKLGLHKTDPAVERAIRYTLSSYVFAAAHGTGTRTNKYGRMLRYLHKRNSEALRDFVVGKDITSASEWDQTVAKFMAIGKRKPKAAVAEADPVERVVPTVGITKCLNVRKRRVIRQ